jgi:hypothetical protein
MLQISPPDASRRHSLELAREYLVQPLNGANIGQVHRDVPWTDDTPASAPGLVEPAIGRHVASLIQDGATLQTGIDQVRGADVFSNIAFAVSEICLCSSRISATPLAAMAACTNCTS